MIDKGVFDKGCAWNPRNCEFECDKSCDVGEYLDCQCKKKLVDRLVEECSVNVDETKLALFQHGNECIGYYTVFILSAVIVLTVSTGVGAYYTYKYMNRNKEKVSIYDYVYQAKNY